MRRRGVTQSRNGAAAWPRLPRTVQHYVMSFSAPTDLGQLYWCAPGSVATYLAQTRTCTVSGAHLARESRTHPGGEVAARFGAQLALSCAAGLHHLEVSWRVQPGRLSAALALGRVVLAAIISNRDTLRRVVLDRWLLRNPKVGRALAACPLADTFTLFRRPFPAADEEAQGDLTTAVW